MPEPGEAPAVALQPTTPARLAIRSTKTRSETGGEGWRGPACRHAAVLLDISVPLRRTRLPLRRSLVTLHVTLRATLRGVRQAPRLPHQLYQTHVEEDMGIDHGSHGQATYKTPTHDRHRRAWDAVTLFRLS